MFTDFEKTEDNQSFDAPTHTYVSNVRTDVHVRKSERVCTQYISIPLLLGAFAWK